MSIRTAAALFVASGLLIAACDHGAVLLAENQTDQELVARALGSTDAGGCCRPQEITVVLAPNSKHVIAVMPFTVGFDIQHLDILAADCSSIDSRALFGSDGTYVVINDDLHVEVRKEFPQSGDPAPTTDRCRMTPDSTPVPSPVPTP
jgi:hypothetical protein